MFASISTWTIRACLALVHRARSHRLALSHSMLLLTPLQSAAVIAANSLVGKVWITLRWRYFEANSLLGNLYARMWVLPDTSGVKELADGHLKQDPTFKRHRATQLNESEWGAIMLPLCLFFASAGVDASQGCTIMAYSQVGYTLIRSFVGYPWFLGPAVVRYVGLTVGVKTLWDLAFGSI